jgi:Mlc titration factor MtfA (ptsG expression regulator)
VLKSDTDEPTMFSRWWSRPRIHDPLPDRLWRPARERSPLLQSLAADRAEDLRRLAAGFLERKSITPVQGLELSPAERALIACLCCLPVLELGGRWLAGWREVVVYPGAFRVRRSELDEPTGVLHEWEEELSGEAWSEGPLILSWEDLLLDQDEPESGCNVVAHEIAHKLDLRDGILDGTPPLPANRRQAWARDFQSAFDSLCAEVEAGQDTLIDPYAATAPEEFFAVVSEYHFSASPVLGETLPTVAAHLRAFYGPSPFESDRPERPEVDGKSPRT